MQTSVQPIPVWDSFIRGYHWLQALCIGGLWYTGTEGLMDWHFAIAYFLLALLLTRFIWGVIGSETAQFTHFVRSPRTTIRYLSSIHSEKKPSHVGHNPAGGYMVIAFMVLIATQLTTGLFANDDIISEGPFAMYVSGEISSLLTEIHAINFNVILGAIGLHLTAIIIYLLKKDNLISPMLHGKKQITEANKPKLSNSLIAWGVFLVLGTLIYQRFAKDVVIYLF
ncbi:cytochrome b/b6 domain-containing protein [Photobacterium makurazakiensis]|uniref:cytochrome b/b6 domain-containing protein n=1 Tax=Photobacterium makurazakiensis TaxID=2910234 RepID=UPI003D13314E